MIKKLMNLTCLNELIMVFRVHFPTRSSDRFNFHFGLSLVLDFTVKFSRYQDFRKKMKFEFDSGRHEKPYI